MTTLYLISLMISHFSLISSQTPHFANFDEAAPGTSTSATTTSAAATTSTATSSSSSDDTLWMYSFLSLCIGMVLLLIVTIIKACYKCVEEDRTSVRNRLRGSKNQLSPQEMPGFYPQQNEQSPSGYYNQPNEPLPKKQNELPRDYYEQGPPNQNYDYNKYGQGQGNLDRNVNPLERPYLENRYQQGSKKDIYSNSKI